MQRIGVGYEGRWGGVDSREPAILSWVVQGEIFSYAVSVYLHTVVIDMGCDSGTLVITDLERLHHAHLLALCEEEIHLAVGDLAELSGLEFCELMRMSPIAKSYRATAYYNGPLACSVDIPWDDAAWWFSDGGGI